MPNPYKGSGAEFAIGPASNNLTVISGAGNGLSDVDIPESKTTRVTPGGGSSYRAETGTEDFSVSFTVDANSLTWPLLYRKSGVEIFFRRGPLGTATGSPRETGSFIADSIPVAIQTGDVLTFTVQAGGNGPITYDTYP